MAVGLILRFAGKGRADYEAVNAKLGIEESSDTAGWPAGLLSHAAGEADGALLVLEVWESRDAQSRFLQERLGPALQQAGVSGMPETTWIDPLIGFHASES
jgi:hypothetical protein